MANRDNHYEAAFEEYLRARQIPYVAVEESRRSLLGDGSLKSLDFLVSAPNGVTWLVDVKGRRFPSGDEQKQYWKNWSTRDDVRSLLSWERLFGPKFVGAFVFAFLLVGDRSPVPIEQLFEHRGQWYGFVGVRLEHYVCFARRLSPKWDTVTMPAGEFRRWASPIERLFSEDLTCGPPRAAMQD